MKHLLIFSMLASMAWGLAAADATLDGGRIKAEFSLKGGAVTALWNGQGKSLTFPDTKSVTERLFTEQDGKVLTERFAALDFRVERSVFQKNKTAELTLTAAGTAAFDWLRVTKEYVFVWNKPEVTVKYTLRNHDGRKHSAGVWIQGFFAVEEGSVIFQPRDGKMTELTHPGSARSDEWSFNPGLALAGVAGKTTPAGVTLELLPAKYMGGFYSWCSSKNAQHTTELFTRELEIAPGAEVSFTLKVGYVGNVAAALKALAARPEAKIDAPEGKAVQLDKLPESSPAAGTLPVPARFADVKIKRQPYESLRAITIPASEQIAKVGAYILSNQRIERDRPLPSVLKTLPDGSRKLIFAVPGLAPHGAIYTKTVNGLAYDVFGSPKNPILLGETDWTVRIALDSPADAPALQADRAELVYNGDFEKPSAAGKFADGNFWHELTLSKKLAFWEKGGKDGSQCVRIKREGPSGTAVYSMTFYVEPGRKYTVSADIKCENPDKKYAIAYVQCFDAEGKAIPKSKIIFANEKASCDWKRVSKTIAVPDNALKMQVCFQLSAAGLENVLWVDNVSVEPEDFSFQPKPALETARENAILSGYTPLANLEKISHEYGTPHEKWFKPAAFQLPELLYCCTILQTNEDASRREIVELSQRLDCRYQFVPVLPEITSMRRQFGVLPAELGKKMSDYTLERLKALSETPKLALIQGLDFNRYDADGAFAALLAGLQDKGMKTVFLDCANIPAALTGEPRAVPEEWKLIPYMNRGDRADRHWRDYEKGAAFQFGDPHYVQLNDFPSTPAAQRGQLSPSYVSRDFPFWEYRYLPLIKALRRAAGVRTPVMTALSSDGKTLKLKVNSPSELAVRFAIEIKSLNRELDGKTVQDVKLVAGEQETSVALPPLPGGAHVAHCRILDAENRVLDAGALRFDTPQSCQVAIKFADPDAVFESGKPVAFVVECAKTDPGDMLELAVEDSAFRTVYRSEVPAEANRRFEITLHEPRTILYRVFARIRRGGETVARVMSEFSSPYLLDPTEQHAGMWGGRKLVSPMLRELGFDLRSVDGRRDNNREGTLREIVNLGMHPLILNLSLVADSLSKNRAYTADRASDPVRDPCYSDPAVADAAREGLTRHIRGNRYRYYGGFYHMLGDEMYLGSTVCFSEHCLKNFRAAMRKTYGSVAELNREWGTSFADFDAVLPVQRDKVENSADLAPWLDHKMFMAGVFAHDFIGRRIAVIQECLPGAQVGMSGTQVPGYSYDWAQLMKHLGCTAYYNGVQTTLINQWMKPRSLSGQWGGGYVGSDRLFDIYQRALSWSNLFKGANTAWNWHGSAFNGDSSPTENLRSYCDEFNLLKRGLAKLLLSAESLQSPVAVLYSQPSLFTAMAGGLGQAEWQNTQTGWDELLRDLKLDATYITYENLADPGFDLSRFKIVLLPQALALSEAERANLVRFAEQGGTVIADVAPGRYDSHGKRIAGTVLDKLFPANTGAIAPRMTDLDQGFLRGRFRIVEPALGTVIKTACGKGCGVLLNVSLSSYQALVIGGGGELARAAGGSAAYCQSLRRLVGQLAADAQALPHAAVTDAKGTLIPSQSVLKKAGRNYYFGLLRYTDLMKPGKIDFADAPLLSVKLPVSGVIYDVRAGRKIAAGNAFQVKAPDGYGQLFAVLPAEVAPVQVSGPDTVTPGGVVRLSCVAPGAESTTVYRLELFAPDGKEQKIYARNRCFDTARGTFEFQIPCDAPQGKWRAVVTHVAGGQRGEKSFQVGK